MSDKSIPSQPRRRSFLKHSLAGASTAVALPWLNSLPVRSEESGKLAVGEREKGGPPTRFGCIFFSNGVEPEHWWAKKEAEGVRFGKGLEPLQQHSSDITFLKGLFNEQADKHPSPHMGRMANFLSGAWISRDQSEIRAGQSMDQFLANIVGRETELPSLALGVEPTELRLEDGLSMIYGSCISWASETQPATKEIYPARVYDQITGAGGDRKMDRSILDAVAAEANRVRKQVSSSESAKLDEYFESIRSIERRIDKAGKEQSLEGWQPSASEPTFARPNEALPQNVAEHMRLMLDLIILAFQMDKTRIATCMLNNDLSQMNFGFLDGVEGSLHLDLTHNGREPELEAMYLRTNQFHCQQLGYLIERMKKIDEGDANLWDNSILLFGSNLFDGDRHQGSEMPLLLTGGAGSSMSQGRIIDVSKSATEDRRACNLYLSLMDKMGVTLPRFGDSDKRLPI